MYRILFNKATMIAGVAGALLYDSSGSSQPLIDATFVGITTGLGTSLASEFGAGAGEIYAKQRNLQNIDGLLPIGLGSLFGTIAGGYLAFQGASLAIDPDNYRDPQDTYYQVDTRSINLDNSNEYLVIQ